MTLGYQEEDDLRIVVDYLSKHPQVSSIGLWGPLGKLFQDFLFLESQRSTIRTKISNIYFISVISISVSIYI